MSTRAGGTEGPLVVIPAQMAAAGLPGKPLAEIAGQPMLAHVWRAAVEARVGRVVVASPDAEITRAASGFGGHAVTVTPLARATADLAAAAVQKTDPEGEADTVMVVRPDLPGLTSRAIERCLEALGDLAADIGTLAAPIADDEAKTDPSVVKVRLRLTPGSTIARVEDFARLVPPDATGTQFRHIEIYAFRRTALEKPSSSR